MRYFGGKSRIASKISAFLTEVRVDNQVYMEPFLGSANVFCLMADTRIGSDSHPDIIMLLQEIQANTFDYPDSLTEEEYMRLKFADPSALRAFAGFGCSFAGKWFGGYAREGKRDFCRNASSSLRKKAPLLKGAILRHMDYRSLSPEDALIYCDPPYADHTPIHGQRFDSNEFWRVMRSWSKRNTVYISEYTAPEDFECVLEIPTRTDIVGKDGQYQRAERLFKYDAK